MSRTLLIDADIVAYRSAASNEMRIQWDEDTKSVEADLEAAQASARETIDELVEELDATDFLICLSDDVENFRKDIDPTYKQNRAGSERPVHLYDLKEWLAETYPTKLWKRLEADDILGIMATEPHKGDRIMVSMDKDLQTIPGLLYRPHKANEGVRQITPQYASRYHLWQTLTGDTTDGYGGCPGIGAGFAEDILNGLGYVAVPRTITRGPRKGTEVIDWKREQKASVWEAVVSAFHKAGQGEADALRQARLARILHHGDWDGRNVRLWTPELIAN